MANPTPSTPRPVRVYTGRILQTAFSVAILLATLFTALSPKMFSNDWWKTALGVSQVSEAGVGSTPTPERQKIGIVAGHWSDNGDPGARCSDGLTEQQVNYDIASRVRQGLVAQGYEVDLLQEFDPRLENYAAALLLSIHADTCDYIDDQASGFKIAASTVTYNRDQNLANRLTGCLSERYSSVTGLQPHPGSITVNMTDYYAFRAISPVTPAAIIETGFLYLDRDLLANHPDKVAEGIVDGVICFITNQSAQPTQNIGP